MHLCYGARLPSVLTEQQLVSICGFHVWLFQIEPYIPYEYTCEGMLQRVSVLVEKQVRTSTTACYWGLDSENAAPLNVCSFLRICAPALGAGPHWARSRLWRQRPKPPVTRRAGRRVWSVNPPSSHISTAAKVWPGTVDHTFLLLHFWFWCCIKKQN